MPDIQNTPNPSLQSAHHPEERREAIMRALQKVPTMPAVVPHLFEMVQQPDLPIQDLVSAVEYDPGLTSNVLRMANSAYFVGVRAIGSLQEAIVRLGMNRVVELVVAASTAPLVGQPVRGYDLAAGQLSEHSIAVAVGAEALAEELGQAPPRYAFTAGMLHDLGKVVLGTFLEVDVEPILEVAFTRRVPFEEAEHQILGVSHPEVGSVLLEHWNLPYELVEAVRYHHTPESVTGSSLLVDLIHVADQVAIESGVGSGIDGLHYRAFPAVWDRLKLKPAQAEKVLCKMMDGLDAARELINGRKGS